MWQSLLILREFKLTSIPTKIIRKPITLILKTKTEVDPLNNYRLNGSKWKLNPKLIFKTPYYKKTKEKALAESITFFWWEQIDCWLSRGVFKKPLSMSKSATAKKKWSTKG